MSAIADAARTVSAPAVLFPPLKAAMELVANVADGIAMVCPIVLPIYTGSHIAPLGPIQSERSKSTRRLCHGACDCP